MKQHKRNLSVFAGVLAACLFFGMVCSVIPGQANALKSSSEIRKQINELKDQQGELQDKMDELNAQLKENMSEMEDIVLQKSIIDQKVNILNSEIDNINNQISSYSILIADKQDELDDASAHLSALQEKNRDRIRTMEEDGVLSYWSVIFKANSFSDLLDRLNMVEEIAASDQRRLKEMSQAAKDVAAARADLELEKTDLEASREALDAATVELDQNRAEADRLLSELVAKGDEYEALLEKWEAEEEELIAEIAKQEKEFDEAKASEYRQWLSTSIVTTAPTTAPSTPSYTPPSGEGWRVPCSYVYVSSPYGWRTPPTNGASTFHSGVDLAAYWGNPVWATRSGVVTACTYNGSFGNYITINHGDGYSSSYLHLSSQCVSVGQYVSQGQTIGRVGSTGVSTGPHLHFIIYYNGSTVNPANYIPL